MTQAKRWSWIDVSLWSLSAYLVCSQSVNFAGRAAAFSFPSLLPYALSISVAVLGIFVALWDRRFGPIANLPAALATLGAVLGADLLAATIAGKLSVFALFASIPFAAWRFARVVAPRRTWAITGAALGLVVILVSRGLFSFLIVFPPIGLVGVLTAFHEAVGEALARAFHLLPSGDLSDEPFFFRVAPVGGTFWALVYGALGHVADRWRERSRGTGTS